MDNSKSLEKINKTKSFINKIDNCVARLTMIKRNKLLLLEIKERLLLLIP